MNIKGQIKVDGEIYFTCCDSRPRIRIDGVDLHDWLKESGHCYALEDETEYDKTTHVLWSIRYCVRDTPFADGEDFDTVVADVVEQSLSTEYCNGCYSEWTCGLGDYDFVLNGGHSILRELASHEGKYVWVEFN